jgi:predicted amidohydrolase YtcJ
MLQFVGTAMKRCTRNGVLILSLTLAANVFGRALAQSSAPELVLYNGRIVTVNPAFAVAEAVAVSRGRFVAVGTNAEIRRLADGSTRQIDLASRTVLPGLADNHLHDAGGGPGVDLSGARSIDDVLKSVAARTEQTPPGDVIVSNSDWHEAQLKEQRLPLRRDLDRAAPRHPVVIVRGGHEYILNSRALDKWHITTATPEPAGGRITRDSDGELNGELVDRAKNLVTLPPSPALTLDERVAAEVAQHEKLLAAGLTSIRIPGTSIEQYRTLQEVRRRGLLKMRVNVLLRPDRELDAAGVRAWLEASRIRPDEGDEWLRIGGIKLGLDGGFEGGLMREPYAEPWGERGTFFGLQTMPAERYTAIVRELNRLGWRVATHAVGDAAMDLALAAYEAADADRAISGRRWSIEHGFIPQPDQLPRMKKLGLELSVQDHLYLAGPSLVKYWGQKRAFWTTPVKYYLDAGLPTSAGTDSPVVPFNPFWVIYHFVSRDTITGGVMGADQRVSRQDAIRMSTIAVAHLTFEERDKGSIEPGKLADLIVLDRDILAGPDKEIERARAVMTIVGGRIVHQ